MIALALCRFILRFKDASLCGSFFLSRDRSAGSRRRYLFFLRQFCLCGTCILPASDVEAVIDDVLFSEIEKFESGGNPCQFS
jgi:hypothetical protein